MRPLCVAAIIPLLAACAGQETSTSVTRIVNTVTPEETAACIAATAEARGVPQAMVTVAAVTPETTGPALSMDVGGGTAVCKLNAAGEVTSVT